MTTCRHESNARRHARRPPLRRGAKPLHRRGLGPRNRIGIARHDRCPWDRRRKADSEDDDDAPPANDSTPGETLLVVEGRLAGPWVDELARCWATLRDQKRGAPIRVDLEGVTFVSAAGKALLARLHGDGALLTARACMTSAIIEEIAQANERGQ